MQFLCILVALIILWLYFVCLLVHYLSSKQMINRVRREVVDKRQFATTPHMKLVLF